MNIRKSVDYSAKFTALDKLVTANLPQTKLSIQTLENFWWGEDYCGPADGDG